MPLESGRHLPYKPAAVQPACQNQASNTEPVQTHVSFYTQGCAQVGSRKDVNECNDRTSDGKGKINVMFSGLHV